MAGRTQNRGITGVARFGENQESRGKSRVGGFWGVDGKPEGVKMPGRGFSRRERSTCMFYFPIFAILEVFGRFLRGFGVVLGAQRDELGSITEYLRFVHVLHFLF